MKRYSLYLEGGILPAQLVTYLLEKKKKKKKKRKREVIPAL